MSIVPPSLILDLYLSALNKNPDGASTCPSFQRLLRNVFLPLLGDVHPKSHRALVDVLQRLSASHVSDAYLKKNLLAHLYPVIDSDRLSTYDRSVLVQVMLETFSPSSNSTILGSTIKLFQQHVLRFEDRFEALSVATASEKLRLMSAIVEDLQEWIQALWSVAHNKRDTHINIVRQSLVALTRMHDALSLDYRSIYSPECRHKPTIIRNNLLRTRPVILAESNMEDAVLWLWREVLVLSVLPPHVHNNLASSSPYSPSKGNLTLHTLSDLSRDRAADVIDSLLDIREPEPAPSYEGTMGWPLARQHWCEEMRHAARDVHRIGTAVLEGA